MLAEKPVHVEEDGSRKILPRARVGAGIYFFSKLMGLTRSLGSQEPAKEQESREADREPVSSTLSEGLQPRVQK